MKYTIKAVINIPGYAWIMWLIAGAFFFYKNLLQVSPGVMSEDLMSAFAVSAAGLGSLTACYFYTYTLMQIPVGMLVDKFGLRHLTACAIGLCALGAWLFANAHDLYTASLARALIGLGAAFAPASCFKLVALSFPINRFALLGGMSLTFGMLGAVCGGGPLSALVMHYGWREALTLLSIPGFLLAVVYWLAIRDKAMRYAAVDHAIAQQPFWQSLRKVLLNKQTWLLSLYSGLAYAPLSAIGGLWGVPFLIQARHYLPNEAASCVSLVFVGFAIGAPLSGWFSDYIEKRIIVIVIGTLLALLPLIWIIYVPGLSPEMLAVLMFIFGFGSGCYFLCFSMIRELNSLALAATVIGFMNTFDSVWESFTHPLIGKILDILWDGKMEQGARIFSEHGYQVALFILPAYLFIGLLTLFFIKETNCKQQSL